ncbi:MAG: TadE/TadG family type IV pilus assembly protein [Candidatus Dormibacteria bacterium]
MTTHDRRPSCFTEARPQAGQALVEFSFVAPLFFFLLFFAVSAGFYTLERASAVNATAAGARIAAGAQAGNLNQPALAEARAEAVRLLASAMPGTRIEVEAAAPAPCPALDTIPMATVFVCTSAPTSDTVRVEVIGHPASFLSPRAGGLTLPLDIYAQVHTAVFKR